MDPYRIHPLYRHSHIIYHMRVYYIYSFILYIVYDTWLWQPAYITNILASLVYYICWIDASRAASFINDGAARIERLVPWGAPIIKKTRCFYTYFPTYDVMYMYIIWICVCIFLICLWVRAADEREYNFFYLFILLWFIIICVRIRGQGRSLSIIVWMPLYCCVAAGGRRRWRPTNIWVFSICIIMFLWRTRLEWLKYVCVCVCVVHWRLRRQLHYMYMDGTVPRIKNLNSTFIDKKNYYK